MPLIIIGCCVSPSFTSPTAAGGRDVDGSNELPSPTNDSLRNSGKQASSFFAYHPIMC